MSDPRHYLAFETGGTKLVAGIAGSDRRIRKSVTVRRVPGNRAGQSLESILAAAADLLSSERIQKEQLAAIGFGFGGTVHRSTNRPHRCLHEDGWDEMDVAGAVRERFGAPVFLENDCKLAALAEAHFGSGADARSVFYMTLGTGVGGGYVRDGRIAEFGEFGEAEIGHVVVEPDGPECCCGSRGCVEALCSGPGLASLCGMLARERPAEWRASDLGKGKSDPAEVSSERIVRCWQAGDAFAARMVERSAGYLATALAAAINLLVPERVVIGGGLGLASPALLDLVRERTRPLVVPYFRDAYSIAPSSLSEQVVTQGAAILASQRAG